VKVTSVFEQNITAYNKTSPLIINQGGTSSSKTYSILQLLFLIAKKKKKPRIISVVSFALPHLKLGAIRDFNSILLSNGIIPDEVCKKTDMEYHIGNSIIEFFGTENLGKVHGPRRDILFLNEANNVKYDIYTQLAIRTRETIFIDYNPTQSFWVHEEVIPSFPHEFVLSTYKDNDFLDYNTIQQIESRRSNENWWKVYGLGQLGKLEGAIFYNWRFGEFDDSLPYSFGMDFGYNHPDTMVKCAFDHKKRIIYADEKFYKSGNSYEDLKQLVMSNAKRTDLITADCAEARMVGELSKLFNINPVNKKTMTVSEGLKIMQGYEIVITETSKNLEKELRNYLWNDKKAGIPIDAFNHIIDAMRYAWMQSVSPQTEYFFNKSYEDEEDGD
jgi:phage terminase large subunit